MTIVVDDTIVGIWFVGFTGHDWMGAISKTDNDKYKIVYRFRYYESEAAFDSGDRKSWYEATTDSRDNAINGIREMVKIISTIRNGESYEVMREDGETPDQFLERFQKQPFVHTKKVEKGTPEYDELTGKLGKVKH